MTKEALDTGDEDEKEELDELTTEFEQLTEWLKGVLGDKLKSTPKEMTGIGDENQIQTIGQIGKGSLSLAKADVR